MITTPPPADLTSSREGSPARARRLGPVFWAISAGLAARLLICGLAPLIMDEAYHVDWARHLQPGYLDHPPAVAWLMAVPLRLLGSSPLALRLPAILLQTISLALAASLVRARAGERAALAAVLGLQAAPIFFLGGGLILPDSPLLLACVGTFWALQRAVDRRPAWFLAAGAFLGLGALSKLTAGPVGVAVLAGLLATRDGRRLLRTPWPWLGAALAVAIASPMLLWNAANGWPSFTYQAAHGLSGRSFSLGRLLASLGGQLGYVSPILLVLAAGAGWRALRGLRTRGDALEAALAFAALPLAAFFTISAAFTPGALPHWSAPAWLAALLLLCLTGAAAGRWWRRALALGFGMLAVAVVGVTLLLAVPLPGSVTILGRTFPVKLGALDDFVGWREGAQAARAAAGDARLAVGHWMHLGQLGLYDGRSPAYLGAKPSGPTLYDPDPRAAGRPLLLVTVDGQGPQRGELEERVGPLEPAGSFEARRGERLVRTYRFYWWRPPAAQ
jgi:4-amino-4-deoxy-L-arabinose transferase-like glycosyltransferase